MSLKSRLLVGIVCSVGLPVVGAPAADFSPDFGADNPRNDKRKLQNPAGRSPQLAMHEVLQSLRDFGHDDNFRHSMKGAGVRPKSVPLAPCPNAVTLVKWNLEAKCKT